MRILVDDDEARAKVQGILDYALDPKNYYEPHKDPVPGDNENYVVYLNSYRCVFTITRIRPSLVRQLSVSVVPQNGKYPSKEAVTMIAHLFGFEGELESWSIAAPKEPVPHVVVAQKYATPTLH